MSSPSPATAAFAVTPSDTLKIPQGTARALYVGVTGNITLLPNRDAASVLFSNVPVGIFPVGAFQVLATGTTATGIVALY